MTFDEIIKVVKPLPTVSSFQELEDHLSKHTPHTLCELDSILSVREAMQCIKKDEIDGVFFEVGVWRGGLAAVIQHINEELALNRSIYLCDTFSGFVSDQIKHTKDKEAYELFSTLPPIHNDENVLYELFDSLSLSKDKLNIIKGDLCVRLLEIEIPPISLLHIDVDFFVPTYEALEILYPKVVKGGYIFIDDYNVPYFNCKDAVDQFRKKYQITSEMIACGTHAIYFRK